MSNRYTLYTISAKEAPTGDGLKQLLVRQGRSLAGMEDKVFHDIQERMWEDDYVALWIHFGAVLSRISGTHSVFDITNDPLTWAMMTRNEVPGTMDVRYNAPEDTVAVAARLATVTAEELNGAITRDLAATTGAGHESKSWADRDSIVAMREMRFWGELRAFYARTAAERRYVVLLIS